MVEATVLAFLLAFLGHGMSVVPELVMALAIGEESVAPLYHKYTRIKQTIPERFGGEVWVCIGQWAGED